MTKKAEELGVKQPHYRLNFENLSMVGVLPFYHNAHMHKNTITKLKTSQNTTAVHSLN